MNQSGRYRAARAAKNISYVTNKTDQIPAKF